MKKSLLQLSLAGLVLSSILPVHADQYYDEGLKQFQGKNYKKAIGYFEQSVKNVPWESGSWYYCAVAYHYLKDYKNAAANYAVVIERFPGTAASKNATAALRTIDPNYMSKRNTSAGQTSESKGRGAQSSSYTSDGKDKGTVEGNSCRVYFSKQGRDMLVDVRVGGRGIKAIFDPVGEDTVFSRGQLKALAINVPGNTNEQRVDIQLGQLTRKNFPLKIDDGAAAQPRVGQSFLDAFSYQVDNAGNWIDLQRKSSGTAGGAVSRNDVPFVRDGKNIVINAEINGRMVPVIFDPAADGVTMPQRIVKSLGLSTEDAEEIKPLPSEGPQRGEAGWVSPEERQLTKHLSVRRLKVGPAEKSNVQAQIVESNDKYAKVGADIASAWKYDVDYQTNVIHFNRR